MRRSLIPASVLCLALFAGCGSDATSSDDSSSDASTANSTATSTATSAGDCPAPSAESTDTTVTDASFPEGKPEVEIPTEIPTELVITDLIVGTGPEAKAGDIVTVNYVGVRSEDGTEFDNSYDSEPFPVTLGQGGVIDGWEQGLLGIQVGGRRQLDIPAELAYGDSPNGDIIQPGDALSFVVDALSIEPGPPLSDPADAPQVEIPKSVGATETTVTELIEGDPCLIAKAGDEVFIQIVLYRGDTGEELQSTWTTGQSVPFTLDNSTYPGLVDGIVGMGVGGRRMIVLPPELGFGAEANTSAGLDADVDIIAIVDLVQIG